MTEKTVSNSNPVLHAVSEIRRGTYLFSNTAGYTHVRIFGTTGCQNTSRSYSQQYNHPWAASNRPLGGLLAHPLSQFLGRGVVDLELAVDLFDDDTVLLFALLGGDVTLFDVRKYALDFAFGRVAVATAAR